VDPERDGTYLTAPLWSGSIYDLMTPVTLSSGLPANAVWDYRLTLSLPVAAGNETQSDRLGFDLRFTADGLTATLVALRNGRGNGLFTSLASSMSAGATSITHGPLAVPEIIVFGAALVATIQARRSVRIRLVASSTTRRHKALS
jgi:hypothetical protein